MDTYAYNLVSRLERGTQFVVFNQSRNNIRDWLLKEFIIPEDLFKLMKIDADLFHAVSPYSAKAAILARKRPLITTVHDLIPHSLPLTPNYNKINPMKRRLLNPWYWLFLKKSDHLIASSEKTKQDAIRILKIAPEKISVVYYGVDHKKFSPVLRKDYHNPKTLLHIGALQMHGGRGTFDLINAFSLVAKKMKNVNLLIGGKGKALPLLAKMANDLGLGDRVKLLGFIPDNTLSYYYNLADVFVLPSYHGFHLMFLDAMSTGLPVIAGNVRDAGEYIGDAGLMITPGNIDQLEKAIISILTDREGYVEMSKRAMKRAQCFSWEKMANETMKVYEAVVSR